MSARAPRAAVAAMTQAAMTSEADQLRAHALRQAAEWNSNASGLRETTSLNEWRDNCRDEIRDELEDSSDRDQLLAAWAAAFDDATLRTANIDAFMQVSAIDIETALDVAHEQLLAMATLFRALSAIGSAHDVQTLSKFGSYQAEELANDLDELRERVVKAGVNGGAA